MNRFGSGLILIVLFSLVLGSAQYAAAAPLQDGDLIASTNIGKLEVFRPDGTLVQTIETGAPSFQAGMCWDQGKNNLRVTNSNFGSITLLDSAVSSIIHPWVSGLNTPFSCVVNASGNFYVSTFNSAADIILFAPDGTQLDTFDLATLISIFDIGLATDNCTLFYVNTALTIKRFDVCTDTQLTDFATVPVSPFGHCTSLQIRPNGEVITACLDVVHRLSSAGALIQSYPVSTFVPPMLIFPQFPIGAETLLLDPDGTSFWTAQPSSGQVYRIDIATGNTIINFGIPTNFLDLLPGNVGDLEIFNTETPPPEQCPPGTVGTPPDCIPINGNGPVGGEMIPLDTTMVLVAGAQYTAAWMIPVIVSGIGIAIVIARKF